MGLRDFRSIYLPYCLQKQGDGTYLVLNREYKPVGFNTNEKVRYQDYPVFTRLKGIGPSTARKLSFSGSEDVNMIFLYNDGCVPVQSAWAMQAYLEKIAILARLENADIYPRK